MVGFLKKIEEISLFFSKKLALYALLSAVLVTIGIIVALNYGWLVNLTSKMIKSVGKSFGEASVVLVEIAFAYYIMREIYVQAKKRKIFIPQILDSGFKNLLTTMRSLHPFVGGLTLCFALLHSYIFLFVLVTGKGEWAIWSGEFAFASMVGVGVLGWSIRRAGQGLWFRKSHRYMSFLFVVLYLFHKAIVD